MGQVQRDGQPVDARVRFTQYRVSYCRSHRLASTMSPQAKACSCAQVLLQDVHKLFELLCWSRRSNDPDGRPRRSSSRHGGHPQESGAQLKRYHRGPVASGRPAPSPHAPSMRLRRRASRDPAKHCVGVYPCHGLNPYPFGGSLHCVSCVQNANNTWAKQNSTAPSSSRAPLNAVQGLTVDLAETITSGPLPHGMFSVQWLDPYTAATSDGPALSCGPGHCTLTEVPTFTRDIAVVLRQTA